MPTLIKEPTPSKYFGTHLATHHTKFQPTRMSRKKYIGGNIRTAIEQVFGALGSWEGMLAWAKDNPDLFYASVIPKLLPAELAESGHGSGITVIIQRSDPQPACTQLPEASAQAEPHKQGGNAQVVDVIAEIHETKDTK